MILRTERLNLREIAQGDTEAIYAYQSNPCFLRYHPSSIRTEEDVEGLVWQLIAWQRERPRFKFQLAIVLAKDNRLIGNCGIRKTAPSACEAELGYEIAPDHWGQGYATEAGRAMLSFAFRDLKLARVYASCVAENIASARVLEKLGMCQERRLRRQQWMKDRWWDELCYSLLAEDWLRQQGELPRECPEQAMLRGTMLAGSSVDG